MKEADKPETMDEISEIDENAQRFIEAQHMFFVGNSPLDPSGRVNLSPKGLDTFRILGPSTVAYVDFTGSEVETIAHSREINGSPQMAIVSRGIY